MVFRDRFDHQFSENLIWWGINSCSVDVHVIEHFLAADSTLFLIEALSARDITGYTNYPEEHEVILQPGIRLNIVANSMEHTGGLHVVHLREVSVGDTHDPLLRLFHLYPRRSRTLRHRKRKPLKRL
jgi:hypothetical protein